MPQQLEPVSVVSHCRGWLHASGEHGVSQYSKPDDVV
jgi:hypothetical protein